MVPVLRVCAALLMISWASAAPIASGTITSPRLVRKVEAGFPDAARRAGIRRAEVHLQVRIDRDGRTRDISVIECSHPGVGFEDAAVRAVRRWRYEPALADGRPIEVYQAVTIPFSLPEDEKASGPRSSA